MPEGQRHPTHGDGCQIGALKESGLSNGAVAARPDRDRPSVWRELRRNGGDSGYSPGEGRGKAEARRGGASRVPRRMTAERRAGVEGFPGRAGARSRPRDGCGWRVAGRWAGSGYMSIRGRPEGGRRAVPAAAPPREKPNRGVAGTRAGATSRAGWTSPGGLRRWRAGSVWATGRPTRSSAEATAGRWSPLWTGPRNTRIHGGLAGPPRLRSPPRCRRRPTPPSTRSRRTTAGSSRATPAWRRR